MLKKAGLARRKLAELKGLAASNPNLALNTFLTRAELSSGAQ